jgi:hypothetical protein
MVNVITGLLAFAMVAVFLGNYAFKIGSVPLSIIIVATLALVGYDYFQSLRNGENQS